MTPRLSRTAQWSVLCAVVATLGACASYDLDQGMARANQATQDFSQGQLQLARSEEDRRQRQAAASRLLSTPLGHTEAVQLMLANSPAFQTMLAQSWAESANAAQSGRIANPIVSFERVVSGGDTEVNRFFSFGLLDVITLPQRASLAEQRLQFIQIKLAAEVVTRVTQVRQAWISAVASTQTLTYAQQVLDSAQASAELARRMEAVGNFNRLTRARHQAFYADAATQLVTAQHNALAKREALVRLLGLDDAQAAQLKLPTRLPDVPHQAMSAQEVGQHASHQRLDVQLAQANLNAAAKAQGLVGITSMTDIELTARKGQVSNDAGTARNHGYEVGVRLPVFDNGQMQRDAMNAQTLAAAHQLEATLRAAGSGLRESYAAYRAAHDISRHYKDEVLPLRKVMADENMLRYNGMLIGVFELLADARDQVSTVMSAIAADEQFWLADASLRANLMGMPSSTRLSSPSSASSSADAGH